MKNRIIILFLLISVTVAGQDVKENFSYATTIGTGLSMSSPSKTPFTWQVLGYYTINQRFAVGAGSGLSVYEKVLIPLYGTAKFNFTKSTKVVPFLECAVGYAFAPEKNAHGGFYLSPSLGGQFSLLKKIKILFAVGYELQELERVKKFSDNHFSSEFKEELSHHSVTFKVGLIF